MAKDGLAKTRRKVQQAVEQAEAEYRRQLQVKRIELAAAGLRAYQQRRHGDAVKNFHTYLGILEDWKGCGEGGLTPSLFDSKKEAPELLLISGIYWDLVKLYDRTKSIQKQNDFLHYLEKYILFSKGMPYQGLCAETLRKYIAVEKPVHKEDFKNAYKMIAVNKCFIATALCDVTDVETVPRLRAFRDGTLASSRTGRFVIRAYYWSGPLLARAVERLPSGSRAGLGCALDGLARLPVIRGRG
ncbi:MAG: hypothetical protein NDJ90_03145 [Oligoflexia bacterium]|nr:hypothetical protein [Oligoflexia bacterium]